MDFNRFNIKYRRNTTMNSSYLQKPQDVERKWYVVDAANKPLGRVAATVASILRGKHLPTFTPNVDCGDLNHCRL